MIKVFIENDRIKLVGHANYAPVGWDIVCAGTTALYQTTTEFLKNIGEQYSLEIKENEITMYTKDLTDKGKLIISSFLFGLKLIEDEFPKNINLIEQA